MNNSKEIQDFEDKIFDKDKNSDIKYNIDYSIEASVKYDFLVETYGKEKVDSIVGDFLKLHDFSHFTEVHKKLQDLA
jgi:hypothetical protein